MKKVLISIGSLSGGGAERVVSVWASELCELGYDVSLLLYCRKNNEYPVAESVNIHTVAENYDEFMKLGYSERFLRMRSIIKEMKPDAVISFLPRIQIWMMFASIGIKTFRIETVRVSPWVICSDNRIEKALWKMCFRFADGVVIQTAEQGEFFSKKIQKKCVTIPNPISQQYYNNYKTDYKKEAISFIAAGRITQQKNYPMMIRAFKIAHSKYDKLRLSIFGTGDKAYLDEIDKLIHELELDGIVKLEGRSNEMSAELCKRDAFLMTSNYEGMPNALLEAMASGLVCVSTNCRTGPKDLIDDQKNGFLINVNDVNAAADAIIKIAEMSSEEMKSIGEAARDKAMSLCSKGNSLNKLVELIENGIKN